MIGNTIFAVKGDTMVDVQYVSSADEPNRLTVPVEVLRLALQALYGFLLNGTCPSASIHVVPHLVMRSNLDLFLEGLPVDLEPSVR